MARPSRLIALVTLAFAATTLPGFVASADTVYVIRSGDTLFGIAARHGVPLSALLEVNGLTMTSVIHPGQRLTIPDGSTSGSSSSPSSGSGGTQYTVQSGDFLIGIAGRHGVSLAALLAANDGLTVDTVIHPGQRLTIPGGSTAPSQPPAASGGGGGGQYTVQAGDYLFAIAQRHGVSLGALISANGLTVDSVIHPGQRLTIPGGGAAPSQPPAASGGGGQYTVRAGDSLGAIAAEHDVTLGALLAANAGVTVNSVIHPGDQLTLPAGASAPRPAASPVDRVLAYALAQVGKPYKFFTKGPNSFDCSGLTKSAYAQVGIELIHHSASQARQGTAVDFHNEPIRPGDLVFLNTTGGTGINHVGIAVNGSSWVQARSPAMGVRITPLPSDSDILAVRRFLPAG